MIDSESLLRARAPQMRDLLLAVRQYRMEVLPTGDEDERGAAEELDYALKAFDSYCPMHGGYDLDQYGPGRCPGCIAERGVLG